jgi:hypothetical protein
VLTQPLILVVARANLSVYQLVAVSLSRLPLGASFRPHSTYLGLTSDFSSRLRALLLCIIAAIMSLSKTPETIIEGQVSPRRLLGQDPVHVSCAVVLVLLELLERD